MRTIRAVVMSSLAGFALISLVACSSDSSDEASSAPESGIIDPDASGGEFTTNCGTLFQGELFNPISDGRGELVTVIRVAAANALVIRRGPGEQLIKLVGLSDRVSDFQEARAIEFLSGLLGEAFLYPADGDCAVTVTGGGRGIAGSLFSVATRQSFSEALLTRGFAEADGSGICGIPQIRDCYRALADDNRVRTGGTVTNFVWKPRSERDGRLVVLFNPFAERVFANNEELVQSGASNGRSTTVRGNREGCGYGANVTLTALDSSGRLLVWPNNELSFNIPNGCNRVEF